MKTVEFNIFIAHIVSSSWLECPKISLFFVQSTFFFQLTELSMKWLCGEMENLIVAICVTEKNVIWGPLVDQSIGAGVARYQWPLTSAMTVLCRIEYLDNEAKMENRVHCFGPNLLRKSIDFRLDSNAKFTSSKFPIILGKFFVPAVLTRRISN